MAATDNRPFFLNLIKIHLPVTGFVSIFQRVSGLILFLAIPFSIYLLDLSLQNADGFNAAAKLISQPLVQLASLILLWSIVHHFIAGIRFLLIDFDIGIEKKQATRFAWLVFMLEAAVFVILAMRIYL